MKLSSLMEEHSINEPAGSSRRDAESMLARLLEAEKANTCGQESRQTYRETHKRAVRGYSASMPGPGSWNLLPGYLISAEVN